VYEYQIKHLDLGTNQKQKGASVGTELEVNQNLKENPFAKATAEALKEHACKVLMDVLQNSDASHQYCKDETETQLTVDLYTSHYSMQKHTVAIKSSDMLHLTNILYDNMEPDSRNPDNQGIRIDKAEADRVYKLIHQILPQEKTDGRDGTFGTVPYSDGTIAIAQENGEWHNFTMHPRFLEFANTGIEEPTFCWNTQVPIPRSLSIEAQKGRRGVRVVKPMNLQKGPDVDIPEIGPGSHYPWAMLLELLEDLSGSAKGENFTRTVKYKLNGSSFSDLRNSFEGLQDTINKEMQDHSGNATYLAELLQRLENGKIYIAKIRESMEDRELRDYMDAQVRRRHNYKLYLNSLKEGMDAATSAQEQYKKEVVYTYQKLCLINDVTQACDLPDEITGAMQLNQERPKFSEAKKEKIRRMKKDAKASPSKAVLEQLVRSAGEAGKVDMEKLKEMVGNPSRTFKKSVLEKKGVLVNLNEMIPQNVRKELRFIFQYDSESYSVKVFVKSTLLREFRITRQDLQLLDEGRKNAVIAYGDDFLWFRCFNLRRLLALIHAECGL
jgi:hypothetical protein